ncbi:p10 [Rachiplusia ou multiple nucleopolyhedrovirus]|uniref:p10 n=1 Tax=Rachiplusia ou multiple nucleopolyhedrovirus (strain R1) TaxID=654904 RepID=Q8B9C5_NPVR1|nr:p10 [Rachiplusia ou multiple nucleopolyhedrovirus]AAN28152.1 p10 [Rachiplusia ou multiple nucleopolyhedrovirus]
MSKPNVLTQILDAVTETNTKVDSVQTQLNGLEESFQLLDGLPAQLTDLNTKVSEIQSILTGDIVPDLPNSLKPNLKSQAFELDSDTRRGKRSSK